MVDHTGYQSTTRFPPETRAWRSCLAVRFIYSDNRKKYYAHSNCYHQFDLYVILVEV